MGCSESKAARGATPDAHAARSQSVDAAQTTQQGATGMTTALEASMRTQPAGGGRRGGDINDDDNDDHPNGTAVAVRKDKDITIATVESAVHTPADQWRGVRPAHDCLRGESASSFSTWAHGDSYAALPAVGTESRPHAPADGAHNNHDHNNHDAPNGRGHHDNVISIIPSEEQQQPARRRGTEPCPTVPEGAAAAHAPAPWGKNPRELLSRSNRLALAKLTRGQSTAHLIRYLTSLRRTNAGGGGGGRGSGNNAATGSPVATSPLGPDSPNSTFLRLEGIPLLMSTGTDLPLHETSGSAFSLLDNDALLIDASRLSFRRRRCLDTRFANSGCLLPPIPGNVGAHQPEWLQAQAYHAQGYLDLAECAWRDIVVKCQAARSVPLTRCATCHLAAVLHDKEDFKAAERLLLACLRDERERHSSDPVDIGVRYNLGLVLRDRGVDDMREVEEHTRAAMEGMARAHGMDSIECLTAMSELAMIVFAQARITEACFLANYAVQVVEQRFGADHQEASMMVSRVSELVRDSPVAKWYRDAAPGFPDEAIVVKAPGAAINWAWSGSLFLGVHNSAGTACLTPHLGKSLKTVNGTLVLSEKHLEALLTHTTVVALRFADGEHDDSDSEDDEGDAPPMMLDGVPVEESTRTCSQWCLTPLRGVPPEGTQRVQF